MLKTIKRRDKEAIDSIIILIWLRYFSMIVYEDQFNIEMRRRLGVIKVRLWIEAKDGSNPLARCR